MSTRSKYVKIINTCQNQGTIFQLQPSWKRSTRKAQHLAVLSCALRSSQVISTRDRPDFGMEPGHSHNLVMIVMSDPKDSDTL